jgi:hypothetical protein
MYVRTLSRHFYGFRQFHFSHDSLRTSVSSEFHEIRLATDEGQCWQTDRQRNMMKAAAVTLCNIFQTHLKIRHIGRLTVFLCRIRKEECAWKWEDIIKMKSKKWNWKAWTRLIWPRTGTIGGRLWTRYLEVPHSMYSFAEEVLALAEELTSSAPRCSPLADLCALHRK